ncbi:hypothetical protein DCCM_2964 [Desulfocucumis palustris]|uniref:Uncharacterized protein n=1 Tax=Desulfocucumis palustris TaxID=1898651 RepID=A0A2L2XDQ5_9FIRM|nr:hypothetical protein DCCM_2964 [Desulfocucumis palustris]
MAVEGNRRFHNFLTSVIIYSYGFCHCINNHNHKDSFIFVDISIFTPDIPFYKKSRKA